MKKIFVVTFLLLLGFDTFSQTSKGTTVLTGSFSLRTISNNNKNNEAKKKDTSFKIAPSIGFMLNDGLEAGTMVSYTHSKTNTENFILIDGQAELNSKSEDLEKSYSVQPYIKKYFMISSHIAITGKAYADFYTGRTKSESESHNSGYTSRSDNKNYGFGVGVSPGITFFPTEKIGLTANFGSLAFTRTTHKSKLWVDNDYKSTTSNFGLDLSAGSLIFGFGYYINR